MLKLSHSNYTKLVKPKQFGQALRGFINQVAADEFSYLWGNYILGNQSNCASLEMMTYLPKIFFSTPTAFALTGASYKIFLNDELISRQQIYQAQKGDILHFGKVKKGVRLYLAILGGIKLVSLIFYDYKTNNQLIKVINQKKIYQLCTWLAPNGFIRITKAPEWQYLKDPKKFCQQIWEISPHSSFMGLRLQGEKIKMKKYDIISSVVNDGTIQMSHNSPFVLMRQRATIGGFPRIANIIEADMDLLSQISFKKKIAFQLISSQQAKEINQKRYQVIKSMQL